MGDAIGELYRLKKGDGSKLRDDHRGSAGPRQRPDVADPEVWKNQAFLPNSDYAATRALAGNDRGRRNPEKHRKF
jgi:hypothetical protein